MSKSGINSFHPFEGVCFIGKAIIRTMASPAPSTDSTQEERQFVPQSDDEETLWEVIEITAERPKQYKVKWKGIDPDTGRPWAQSWVPKTDCTDDLRRVWKKKLKIKQETTNGKGKGKERSTSTSTTIYACLNTMCRQSPSVQSINSIYVDCS